MAGLPVLTLVVLGAGVAFLTTGTPAGLAAGVAFVVLGAILGVLAVVTLRGWFTLEIGPEALALVGLFGLGRFEVPWEEVEAIGLVRWRGARILGLRPERPWPRRPTPLALRWDAERQLLLICGGER